MLTERVRLGSRLFWLLVALVGVFCLVRLAVVTHEACYLVGLPALLFTIARALD